MCLFILDLSAKYWLRNHLSAENIIKEGFYDIGSAGINLENAKPLSPLATLITMPIDKRREIIHISQESDQRFLKICHAAASTLTNRTPRQQIRLVAVLVCHAMGGSVEPNRIAEFSYKFRMTELKLKLGSNVIPIGRIDTGIFYHRALLFKAVCDVVGLGPCTLHRGDYNRAWNTFNLKKHVLGHQSAEMNASRVAAAAAPSSLSVTQPPAPASAKTSAHSASSAAKLKRLSSVEPASVTSGARSTLGAMNENAPTAVATPAVVIEDLSSMFPSNWSAPEEPEDIPEENVIVDLMFEPGRLINICSPEADSYQRG